MVPELRQAYNAAFSAERYEALQKDLDAQAGAHVDFRISETPIFLSADLTSRLIEASSDVLAAVRSESYLAASRRAIPPGREVPGEDSHPAFLQIDFALVYGESGEIEPRLIELQGFPSLYGFQWALARAYREHFAPGMSAAAGWTPYFVPGDEAEYVRRLGELIVGDCDPRQVVLLEIEPEGQKTRVDFACMEQMLGIPTVDARTVVARDGRLYYPGPGGVETPIRRIYNRVIFDEMERKGLDLGEIFFRPHEEIEWVGHPNWFARISKFTLPFLRSRYAPRAWFVSDLAELPEDLESYVLKPLFSFAGLGVELGPSAERLRQLEHPEHFILQQRVEYAGVIATPDVPAKAEVRMMYLWGESPVLVNNLVRLSKGAMMGVDFNKDQTWIGASVAFHPPG